MRWNVLYLTLLFSMILIVGCSNNEVLENSTDLKDENYSVRKIAWDFLHKKGWNDTANKDWETAVVTTIIVDNYVELLDQNYEGKEVLAVSFKDKENTVVGTPIILVDIDSNKVVGYIPSE
ncbi:hypothetical protein [Lysinibacillus telephonicus]|uniref:Uncharacterized protein n=1 Tax=Lysinibacillus telephonicus TaxID=1714840 RepID=A0A431UY64_9BACI|nr:hypothetical protein [Lysinibacillus telephonicus]RTQ96578.1 hypothetical protein EKG35_00565 [Lysinibacillus telephonicus]